MRTLLLPFALALVLAVQATTTHHELLVHFAKDRSELTTDAREQLDRLLQNCPLNGDFRFTLNGHTDSDGSDRYNQVLSKARSQAVLEHLVARGVPAAFIRMDHSGEASPIRSNADESGMSMNRRVAVTFERRYFNDVAALRSALTEGSQQHFTIDPTEANTIQGREGVRIDFPADAFLDAAGRPAKGSVTIALTEALDDAAMLSHGLATRSGARMLETGGMLQVHASDQSGNRLQLRKGSPMEVSVPTRTLEPGMELFLSADGSDWTATGQPLAQVGGWQEPPRPSGSRGRVLVPQYRPKLTGKPRKPIIPTPPNPPTEPRRASYPPYRSFFSFLSPGKAEAEADQRYEKALAAYAERVHRYERKMQAYEYDLANFPERMEDYKTLKAEWDAKLAADHRRWREEVYEPFVEAISAERSSDRLVRDSLLARWNAARDSSYKAYLERSDRNGTGDMNGLNAYVFRTNALGWINCDRFLDYPESQQYRVVAHSGSNEAASVHLVFTRIFSILAMQQSSTGAWTSQAVPRTEPMVLFAYTVIDGRPHLCNRPVDPNEEPVLAYEPTSFSELGAVLQGFKRQRQ